MLKAVLSRVRRLFRVETFCIDFCSGLFSMFWGVVIFMHPNFEAVPVYHFLQGSGSILVWAIAGLAIGVAQVAAVLLDIYWLRLAANGLMIALFGGMAFGTHQTLAASPTWAAYLGWAFANAFSALRVM
jgi:hypothetical protein